MTDRPLSAENRLGQLLERLLTAAESSLFAGDLEPARATAEEVRAIDPGNERAAQILDRVTRRHRAPLGERALMTLLFSDLVGSTQLAEQAEPERVRDIFSIYRSEAKAAVERYGGYVMQYSGDGILAGFGYPHAHEDDARRAVLAALELVTGMARARGETGSLFGVEPHVRVGIHTGRVVVTDLGEARNVREHESIAGAAPNLAARIQQEAEPDTVVISDVTQQLVETDFYVHSLGVRRLKGISRPVEVFAVDRVRYAGARLDAERFRRVGLVGRDEPRSHLVAAWDAVRGVGSDLGEGQVFLVVGEAGIGKTRLVAEIRDYVVSGDGDVLGADCLPYYANISLWPIAQMLERVLGLGLAEEPDRLGRLAEYLTALGLEPDHNVPFLAPLIGIGDAEGYPAPKLDPAAFLDETLNRLAGWLGRLSGSRPRLLVVEDVHWADPSTLGVLGRLAHHPPRGVLTITTSREGSAVAWRDRVEVLTLGRLDERTSETLVNRLVDEHGLPEELRSSIVARGEGIPLFIEELARSRVESEAGAPLPLRLQELLTGRLKAPGLDLRVAQVAATVGPTFDASTVAAVVDDEDRTTDQLARFEEAGIVDRGEPGVGAYRFRHALQRDAAYETQVLEVRSQTHARVADVLRDQGAAAALVAQHLDLAGELQRAVTQYLAAAQEAQGHGAHTEATRLLSRALDLLEGLAEGEERDLTELTVRMLRGLSVSSMKGYAAPEVQADHRRAEVLAQQLGPRPEILPSLIAIWAYWLVSADLVTSKSLIDRLTEMIGDPAYAWFEPEVESCAGWQAFYQGELRAARSHLERSMAGYRERPDDQMVSPFWPLPNDPVAVSAIALACVSTLEGDAQQAELWEKDAVRRAEDIGFPRGPFSLAFVKVYGAWLRRFVGDTDGARALGAEVVGIGQEYGYAYWVMLGSAYLPAADTGAEPDPDFIEQNIRTLRLMGQEAFVASNLAYLAVAHAARGDHDRAREIIEESLQVVAKTGERIHLPELLRLRAVYGRDRGADPDEVAADLLEAVSIATEQGNNVVALRGAVELGRLPEDHRPAEWRTLLGEAKDRIPAEAPPRT
jgi:class 3 adenylate cyclase